jgi:hypothetical protein
VDAGADGLVVPNHGAHTLDYLCHPLQGMDEIVSAVKGKIAIVVDDGFRRGSDVLGDLLRSRQNSQRELIPLTLEASCHLVAEVFSFPLSTSKQEISYGVSPQIWPALLLVTQC